MAEVAKRPSENAAKSAPGVAPPDSVVRAALGSKVAVRTINQNAETLEGSLYTACPVTNVLVIASGNPSFPVHHIIPFSALVSFTVLSLPSGTHQPVVPGLVDSTAVLSRADAALKTAKAKAAKLNKAVDKSIQDLFDSLDKQFTARWCGKDILVMESVVVKAPGYRSEDCRYVTKDGEGLQGRVRKVLENERKRAAQKAVKPAVPNIMPAVPQGPRKGG